MDKKKIKKGIFSSLFEDKDELEDIETEHKDEPQGLLEMLTESRPKKVDRLVKENKNREGRENEALHDKKRGEDYLDKVKDSKLKAIDGLQGIEIKEIKIFPKKKKDEDDDIADLPTPVTGSF